MKVKKITEVCELIRGTEPGSESYFEESDKDRIRFIRVQDLTGKLDNPKFVSKILKNLTLVKPEEILISFDGTPGIITKGWSGAISSGIRAIRNIKPELSRDFLFYYLQTPVVQKTIRAYSKGATIIHASAAIPHIKILLPPFKIQQKIVEKLDVIKKAQELNDKQIELAEELFQSLLHRELDPKGKNWGIKKLGEVFERVKESILPTEFPEQEFNFIGLENIKPNSGWLISFKPTKGKFIKSTKIKFKKKDTLYGKLRPYLNKVWFSEFDGICSTDFWALRALQNKILPELLPVILARPNIVQRSSLSMTGSNLPRANKNIFDNIKIFLPSIKTQRKIVEKLSAVQEYKKKLLQQKASLKELFESVLNKSMKGKLIK